MSFELTVTEILKIKLQYLKIQISIIFSNTFTQGSFSCIFSKNNSVELLIIIFARPRYIFRDLKKGQAAWPSGQALDSQTSGPLFDVPLRTHLFDGNTEFKSLATFASSQLICLRPVGILNNVIFNLNYLLQLFAQSR